MEYTTGIDLVKLEAVVADQEAMPTAHLILGASHEHGFSDPTVSVSSLEAVFSIGISKLEEKDPSRPMLKVGASLDHGTHAHAYQTAAIAFPFVTQPARLVSTV